LDWKFPENCPLSSADVVLPVEPDGVSCAHSTPEIYSNTLKVRIFFIDGYEMAAKIAIFSNAQVKIITT